MGLGLSELIVLVLVRLFAFCLLLSAPWLADHGDETTRVLGEVWALRSRLSGGCCC